MQHPSLKAGRRRAPASISAGVIVVTRAAQPYLLHASSYISLQLCQLVLSSRNPNCDGETPLD